MRKKKKEEEEKQKGRRTKAKDPLTVTCATRYSKKVIQAEGK